MSYYFPMGVGNSGDLQNGIVGEVRALIAKEPPTNYLACDGAKYNISDYPELTKHFKNTLGSERYFSQSGDALDTFRVPNLNGRFLRGSKDESTDTVGVFLRDSAPNMTGRLGDAWAYRIGSSCSEAITASTRGTSGLESSGSDTGYRGDFLASKGTVDTATMDGNRVTKVTYVSQANSPYGKNSLVTPRNMTILFCIRYQSNRYDYNSNISDSINKSIIAEASKKTFIDKGVEGYVLLTSDWASYRDITFHYNYENEEGYTVQSAYTICMNTNDTPHTSYHHCDYEYMMDELPILSYDLEFGRDVATSAPILVIKNTTRDIQILDVTATSYSTLPMIRNMAGVVKPMLSPRQYDESDGWVLCDGAEYDYRDSRYYNLFRVIGYTYGGNPENYTFKVPDLRGRFAHGCSTDYPVGTYRSAGLPNITGHFGGWDTWSANDMASGCFRCCGDGNSGYSSSGTDPHCYVKFDANKCSDVYGKSDTVQPPSMTITYYISLG